MTTTYENTREWESNGIRFWFDQLERDEQQEVETKVGLLLTKQFIFTGTPCNWDDVLEVWKSVMSDFSSDHFDDPCPCGCGNYNDGRPPMGQDRRNPCVYDHHSQ